MTYLASITSKRQLTLPASVYDYLQLKPGSKLMVSVENNVLRLESTERVLLSLRGSVSLPVGHRVVPQESEIETAKELYFKEKYSK